MVKRSDLIPVLLQACQSFETHWADYSADSQFDPEIFRSFLGAQSARWWDALNRFWAGERPRVELDPPVA